MGLRKILKGTGKGVWFGNGRVFGMQRGSIKERIKDPFYSIADLVSFYDKSGHSISESDETEIIDYLAGEINRGNSSIAAELEKPINNWRRKNVVRWTGGYPVFDRLTQERGNSFFLYSQLISRAETPQSVNFLLGVLESSYREVEGEPFKTAEPVLDGEMVEEGSIYSQKGYESAWTSHFEITYEKLRTDSSHRVSLPFAEQAKERLLDLLPDFDDLVTQKKIEYHLARFDRDKPKETKISAFSKGKELSHTYLYDS